jgi:hypothetical protein
MTIAASAATKRPSRCAVGEADLALGVGIEPARCLRKTGF